LVFCDKPHDYAGLDSMCVYAHNIAHRDHEDIPDPSLRRTPSSLPPQPLFGQSSMRSSTVVCYSCNKPGLTRRTCRTRPPLPTPVPSQSQKTSS
jgi:hypothetical protein